MYHVESLNTEMGDGNKSLIEELIISEYNEEFHLEQLSYEEYEEAAKTQHFLSSALNLSPSWKLQRKEVEYLSENSFKTLNNKYKKSKVCIKSRFQNQYHQGSLCNCLIFFLL